MQYAVATSFLVLLATMIYVLGNNSGHTGFDFRLLIMPGLLLIGTGSLCIIFVRQGNIRRNSSSAIILGFWYIVLPFILEYTRAIVVYDRWAKSGLQEPPEHKNLLVFFTILTMTSSIILPRYAGKFLKPNAKGRHEQ